MTIPISALQLTAAFDPHEDRNKQRWEKWIQTFERFSRATGLHTAAPEVAILHPYVIV